MNNILIPTDFTRDSLQLAEKAINSVKGGKADIILFHAFALPFFVQDLLVAPQKQPYLELLTDDFRQACKQLKEKYPKAIGKIMIKCLQGDTPAIFRNFIDANDIDLIVCPDDYAYSKIHERSVNPLPLFKKGGVTVLRQLKTPVSEINYTVKSIALDQLAVN